MHNKISQLGVPHCKTISLNTRKTLGSDSPLYYIQCKYIGLLYFLYDKEFQIFQCCSWPCETIIGNNSPIQILSSMLMVQNNIQFVMFQLVFYELYEKQNCMSNDKSKDMVRKCKICNRRRLMS